MKLPNQSGEGCFAEQPSQPLVASARLFALNDHKISNLCKKKRMNLVDSTPMYTLNKMNEFNANSSECERVEARMCKFSAKVYNSKRESVYERS